MSAYAGRERRGRVVGAQDQCLDERLLARRLDPGDVVADAHVQLPGDGARGGLPLTGLGLGLVQAEADDGAQADEGAVAGAEHLRRARPAGCRGPGSRPAARSGATRAGLHATCQPSSHAGRLDRGLVGPLGAVELPGPREASRTAVSSSVVTAPCSPPRPAGPRGRRPRWRPAASPAAGSSTGTPLEVTGGEAGGQVVEGRRPAGSPPGRPRGAGAAARRRDDAWATAQRTARGRSVGRAGGGQGHGRGRRPVSPRPARRGPGCAGAGRGCRGTARSRRPGPCCGGPARTAPPAGRRRRRRRRCPGATAPSRVKIATMISGGSTPTAKKSCGRTTRASPRHSTTKHRSKNMLSSPTSSRLIDHDGERDGHAERHGLPARLDAVGPPRARLGPRLAHAVTVGRSRRPAAEPRRGGAESRRAPTPCADVIRPATQGCTDV